jgi:hypothetical protein
MPPECHLASEQFIGPIRTEAFFRRLSVGIEVDKVKMEVAHLVHLNPLPDLGELPN